MKMVVRSHFAVMAIPTAVRRSCSLALMVLLALGCTTTPVLQSSDADAWQHMPLPGKRVTTYTYGQHEGRAAWRADSDASASLLRRRVQVTVTERTTVEFAWWVPALIPAADLRHAETSDSPVRLVFAFDGDVSKLPLRDRMQFQAVEALTGERPPYATLMYVWDNHALPETILRGARSARIKKVVLERGDAHLRQWRGHKRQLKADFVRAFGEEPGNLVAIALLTDSDNTRSKAQAWYGAVVVKP